MPTGQTVVRIAIARDRDFADAVAAAAVAQQLGSPRASTTKGTECFIKLFKSFFCVAQMHAVEVSTSMKVKLGLATMLTLHFFLCVSSSSISLSQVSIPDSNTPARTVPVHHNRG